MPTCYLDFDGVLHHENVARGTRRTARMMETGHQLFEWAAILGDALQSYPHVRIVLSTTWVRVLGYDRSREYLPPELRGRVVGATFHRREHGATRDMRELWAQAARGVQIARDIERRRPAKWFAIDDAIEEFLPWQREWLVPCQGSTGLGSSEAQQRLDEVLRKVHCDAACR